MGQTFGVYSAYWITEIILALDIPLSVDRIILQALLRKLFKWKIFLGLGLFVVGKLYSLPARLLQGRAVALSGYFTFQNPQRRLWFWNDSTPLKRGEPYHCTEDLEKGIKHISLSGSWQGGNWQHLWGSLVVSSPGFGFSAVPCGDSTASTAFPSIFGQSAGYWFAVGFLQCSWELSHQSIPQPQWCALACWAPPTHCLQQSSVLRKL